MFVKQTWLQQLAFGEMVHGPLTFKIVACFGKQVGEAYLDILNSQDLAI
jgi:hypothetical protein